MTRAVAAFLRAERQSLPLPRTWHDFLALIMARDGSPNRIRQLISLSVISAASNILNATIAFLYLRSTLPNSGLLIWYLSTVLLSAWLLTQRHLAASLKIKRISKRTLMIQSGVAVIFAIPWAVLGILVTLHVPEQMQFIPFATLIVFAVGGAIVYSVIPLLAMIYIWSVLAPLIAVTLFQGTVADMLFATCIAYLGIVLTAFSIYHSAVLALNEISDIRQRQQLDHLRVARDDIERLAQIDSVTGLLNRRVFRARLDDVLSKLDPKAENSHAIFLIDLDLFKHVNDAHGHEIGDRYLANIGKRLMEAAGDKTTVGRVGGDEFAVLTDEPLSYEDIVALGQRLLTALSYPHLINGLELKGGCSIGVALAPHHSNTASELMTFADRALRNSKIAQRGTLVIFSDVDLEHVKHRQVLTQDLARALRDKTIDMFYQPQIAMLTGRLIGFEALARWTTPSGETISPPEFLSIAEDGGFIIELTELMLEKIMTDIGTWATAGLDFGSISLNVHPSQLHHAERLNSTLHRLAKLTGRRERIVLEINENCIIGRGMEDVPRILRGFAEQGYRISLDDFGTGFASLTHIKELPIHELKIDRKFVAGITHDAHDQAIVQAILDIAKPRSIAVVAEGIETEQQAMAVVGLGGVIGQGNYYAAALNSKAAVSFIATRQSMLEVVSSMDPSRPQPPLQGAVRAAKTPSADQIS